MKKIRRNEFLLLEQDDDAPKGGPYTPPKERILQYPDVAESSLETNASLDQIVDRYLLQYEKEAVPLNTEPEDKLPQRQPVAERKQRRSSGLYTLNFALMALVIKTPYFFSFDFLAIIHPTNHCD